MKDMIEKLQRVEQRISADKGAFELFALALPDSGLDMWDILVSAQWIELERDELAALEVIASCLNEEFSPDEMVQFSGMVIIERDNPDLHKIHSIVQVEHGEKAFENVSFFGTPLLKAVIITSRKIEDYAFK